MGSFSMMHWLVFALVAMLLLGPGRLAASGKGLGEGIRNFKKGLAGDDDDELEPKKRLPKKSSTDDSEDDG